MINDYKERQRKNAVLMRTIYNITVGILVLVIGVVMLSLDWLHSETLNDYIGYLDPLLRYMFGGLCLIYGIFRLYRGIKKEF